MIRRKAQPAAGFVHPDAIDLIDREGEHDIGLENSAETAAGYLTWIANVCDPYLGHRVLEVGAGVGGVTAGYESGREVVASDLSPVAVEGLQRRFAETPNVEVVGADLRTYETDEKFDSILMVNVLEHIHQDAEALKGLTRMLKPGGNFVIWVPALNGIYGEWDHIAGHYRRYSRWRLRGVFAAAGLEAIDIRYHNSLAVLPWLAFRNSTGSDEDGRLQKLSLWERTGVPATKFIEGHVRPPLGLNLLAVARVPFK